MSPMDNINDLENSSKEQLVEKVESMQEEIDSLKEENSKAKSNLMWKVRKSDISALQDTRPVFRDIHSQADRDSSHSKACGFPLSSQ